MQSALADFLFQQGWQDRPVVHHYLDGLFPKPEVGFSTPTWRHVVVLLCF